MLSLCLGIHFLSVKLHRQPIRWLTNRVLKIPPPAPWVATQIWGMFHVTHPANRHLSPWEPLCWGWNNHAIKIAKLIARGVGDEYHWNLTIILPHQRTVAGVAVIGCAARAWVTPKGTLVTWHKSLAVASIWEVGLTLPGFPWAQEGTHPIVTHTANLPLLQAR